jgi:hypothetical protein
MSRLSSSSARGPARAAPEHRARAVRARSGVIAALACAVLSSMGACSSEPPLVRLRVDRAADAPALADLAELSLEISRCDGPAPSVQRLDRTPGATIALELDLAPGAPVSLWLQGQVSCPASACRPFDGRLAEGVCTCGGPLGSAASLVVAASACTGWIEQASGEVEVPLTLTSTRGLCPAPVDRCARADAG